MRLVPALFCAFLLACSGRSSSSSSSSGDSNPLPDASMPPLQVRLLITLGSSSTAGTGASSTDTRYTNLLAQRLNARLINLGTGGQTVEAVQQTYLPQALAALDAGVPPTGQVDIVTFLPLTDFSSKTSAQLSAGYDAVLTQLDGTQAWVVFGLSFVDPQYQCGAAGPLRGPNGECFGADVVADYAQKDAALRAMMGYHPRVSPVDVPSVEVQHPDYQQPDGHPNDTGHDFIARVFLHAIQERLGQDAGPPPYP